MGRDPQQRGAVQLQLGDVGQDANARIGLTDAEKVIRAIEIERRAGRVRGVL